jgi:hypothetical protein
MTCQDCKKTIEDIEGKLHCCTDEVLRCDACLEVWEIEENRKHNELVQELSGVFEKHICSVGKHYDIYLSICSSAPTSHPDSWATNGVRYVVKFNDKPILNAMFPSHVADFLRQNGAFSDKIEAKEAT